VTGWEWLEVLRKLSFRHGRCLHGGAAASNPTSAAARSGTDSSEGLEYLTTPRYRRAGGQRTRGEAAKVSTRPATRWGALMGSWEAERHRAERFVS
jgi:hypothetical protein